MRFTLPSDNQFQFAGFTFPKWVFTLPGGSFAERIKRMRNPVTGPYYHAPKPNSKGIGFYLDSDSPLGLRWKWADMIATHIRHTGWYYNDSQDGTIRGIVMRLPRNRGFLAGWSMGEGMASEVDATIYHDEIEAAHAANEEARIAAERQREFEEEENERMQAEEQFETEFNAAFENQFMKPQVYEDFYFEIDTTCGLEIVPSDVIGRTCGTDVSAFLDYIEGKPLDSDATIECKHGWLARLSASGYLDCTDWTAHKTEREAKQYLLEMYGE
jgi:hypothetical protein